MRVRWQGPYCYLTWHPARILPQRSRAAVPLKVLFSHSVASSSPSLARWPADPLAFSPAPSPRRSFYHRFSGRLSRHGMGTVCRRRPALCVRAPALGNSCRPIS